MSQPTQEIIDELLLLVSEAADPGAGLHAPDGPGQRLLDSLANELRLLRVRCLRKAAAYKVAVVGLGNVGKSTLINALLDHHVAPVRNGPCTASVVEFRHGPGLRLEVTGNNLLPEVFRFASVSELREKLCVLVDHASAESQAWSRLVVELPAAILANGLIIADTPGFGAAGGAGSQDDQTLEAFLKEDVAQIFWVVMADEGIPAQAHRLYEKLMVERCDDLIVTNAEDWDEQERARWRQRYAPYLRRMPRIHFVSGKEARKARENADIPRWESSGMDVVEKRIQQLAGAPERVEAVANSLEPLGAAVAERLTGAEFHRHSRGLFLKTGAAAFWARHQSAPWMAAWRPLLIPR